MTANEVLQIFREAARCWKAISSSAADCTAASISNARWRCSRCRSSKSSARSWRGKVRPLGAVTVVSPAMGGLVLGQEVARQLGVRFIFVEKEQGKLVLRRGFKIAPGEKILVVEDVVTKGGRVQETMDIVRAHSGQVVGVAMAVDRSGGTVSFGVPMFSLISLQVETFEPDQLPPDLAAIPAVKPGSR